MQDVELTPREALKIYIEALNALTDRSLLERALTADVVIDRFGVFEEHGALVETFRGVDAVSTWFARTAPGITFSLAGEVEEVRVVGVGEALRVRYRYAFMDFEHGGVWTFSCGPGGRIAWLAHHPDVLEEGAGDDIDWEETIAERRRVILGGVEV